MNAVEIEAAISELALQPFDVEEFPYAFLGAFGNKDTTLKRLRTGNNNASDVRGGVLQRNNIHIAVRDVGTVGETLKVLRESPATAKAKAKFILGTDGQTLEAEELVSGETLLKYDRLECVPRPPAHRTEQSRPDRLHRSHPARPRGVFPRHLRRPVRPGQHAGEPALRPRAQRRGAGAG